MDIEKLLDAIRESCKDQEWSSEIEFGFVNKSLENSVSFFERSYNGTKTIIIKINGGAKETTKYWFEKEIIDHVGKI